MIFHDGISEIEIEGTSGETGRVRTQVSHHLPRPQTKGRLTGPLCSFFIASSILSGATGVEKIAGITLKLLAATVPDAFHPWSLDAYSAGMQYGTEESK